MPEDDSNKPANEIRARLIKSRVIGVIGGDDDDARDLVDAGYTDLVRKEEVAVGRGEPTDTLERMEIEGRVITPPFPLRMLSAIPDESSIMRQCVEAMCVNVDCFGWDLEYIGPEEQEESKESLAEKLELETFFWTCNPRRSLSTLRRMMRVDRESTGAGYWEIMRGIDQKPAMIEHLPAVSIRLAKLDKVATPVKVKMVAPGGVVVEREFSLRFRRYVQVLDNHRRIYFKEFGDPRRIRVKDGKVDDSLGEPLRDPDSATEVIAFPIYSARTPYGVPRYIGNMPSIRGARAAERVNESFFSKNCIPAMVVMVSGGALTEDSFKDITTYFREEAGGARNYHRVLVLEAVPHERGLDDKGTVSVTLKPLQNERMQDATHQKYDEICRLKTRSSWRLSSMHLGLSEETNFASANAARIVGEEQVFAPDRNEFDEIMNLNVVRAFGARFWRFFTKGPAIADIGAFVAAVNAFSAVGAMTCNQAIMLANELLGTKQKTRDPKKEPWADVPFVIVMEMAKRATLVGLEDLVEEPEVPEVVPGAAGMDGADQEDVPPADESALNSPPGEKASPVAKHDPRLLRLVGRVKNIEREAHTIVENLSSRGPESLTEEDVAVLAAAASSPRSSAVGHFLRKRSTR